MVVIVGPPQSTDLFPRPGLENCFAAGPDKNTFGPRTRKQHAFFRRRNPIPRRLNQDRAVRRDETPLAILENRQEPEVCPQQAPLHTPLRLAQNFPVLVDERPSISTPHGTQPFGRHGLRTVPFKLGDDTTALVDVTAFSAFLCFLGHHRRSCRGESPCVVPRAGNDKFARSIGVAPLAVLFHRNESVDQRLHLLPLGLGENLAFRIDQAPLRTLAHGGAILFGENLDFVVGAGKQLPARAVDQSPLASELHTRNPERRKRIRFLEARLDGPRQTLGSWRDGVDVGVCRNGLLGTLLPQE